METNDGMKHVEFDKYCPTCEHKDMKEELNPCFECLAEPVNQYSHKPVNYKRKD